jgi:hypothetical protein
MSLLKPKGAPLSAEVKSVCRWAEEFVSLGKNNVAILRREEIDGAALFNLTDLKLKEDGMSRGAREKLLAAVTSLKEPPGGDS